MLVRSLNKLLAIDPGYKIDNVLLVNVKLPESRYSAERARALYEQLTSRLKALPGVTAVSTANNTPLNGNMNIDSVLIENSSKDQTSLPTAFNHSVGPGYFELLGLPLIAGRTFTPQDNAQSPQVVIVSAAFAQKFFPNQNPLGKAPH